jgi:hypothetical protein
LSIPCTPAIVLIATRKNALIATTAILGPSPKGLGNTSMRIGKIAIFGST